MTKHNSATMPSESQAAALVVGMPALAGSPLEAPKFFKTNWHVGQVFRSSDDPDRTSEPWQPPLFISQKDPRAQAKSVRVSELTMHRGTPDRRFARVIRGVLDEEDCVALLSAVNCKGFTPALVNTGMDQQRLMPWARDGHRTIV